MTVLQQLGRLNTAGETSGRSREFAEYARATMLGKGNPDSAMHFAESPRVRLAIKADVVGSVMGDLSVAPYRILSEGFTSTLTNSAFDAVLADAHAVPLHSVFGITTVDATAAAAGEGLAKRLGSISLGSETVEARKAVVICAVSNELLRFASSVALIENSMRNGVAAAVDGIFTAALIALTTPIAASGTTAADVLHDLRILADATGSGSNSRFHLVVGAAVARRLALMATTAGELAFPMMTTSGGAIGGIAVHVSDALTTAALLVDASQLVANADAVSIRISPNASLEMSDTPAQAVADGSPPAPVAATQKVVSMFQTNSTGILCERVFGFSLVRTAAAQSLSGIQWGLVGSPLA